MENADQIAQKAKDVGGSVIMEAVDVFDAGRTAVIQDPQGDVFAVWQPNQHIGSELIQEPCYYQMSGVNDDGYRPGW